MFFLWIIGDQTKTGSEFKHILSGYGTATLAETAVKSAAKKVYLRKRKWKSNDVGRG